MTRILHLRSSCGLYGADRALLDLAQATGAPFEPVVGSIVRPEREDAFGDEAQRRGLDVLRVESRGRADMNSVRFVSEQVRAEGIALLHAHDYKSLSLAALVAARTRAAVVATFHGDTGASPALIAYEALARVLGNVTRGAAAVSAPLQKRLKRWIVTAPVLHIPNGIRVGAMCSEADRQAARDLLDVPRDAEVIAIIGRLSPEKGHAVLFRALRAMAKPPLVLVAGEGPLEEPLRAQAEGLRVKWLGFVKNPRAVYAAADAVVMPSHTEGLPLVGLEAMASGRVLVASSVGELPTLLAGDCGLLVPPGNDEALTRALERVFASADGRQQLAARAYARVSEEYGLDRMAERYARQLYAPALYGRAHRKVVATLGPG